MTGLEALNDLIEDLQQDNGVSIICKEQVEKSLKALEIIKKKSVDIWLIQNKKTLKQYNSMVDESRQLTEVEFELLRSVLV